MADILRSRTRRNITGTQTTESVTPKPMEQKIVVEELEGDIEAYAKEVLSSLIKDGLPPTPNNFSLYFDRHLDDKSQNTRKQIVSILELEESNENENSMTLEQNLKSGFSSIRDILGVIANLYKNMNLMTKILEKRKEELQASSGVNDSLSITASLESDISKLNSILKKQSVNIKSMYDNTADIIKTVESETIFDNQFGVYNKRYLVAKIEQESALIQKLNHKSSLIMIELSKDLKSSITNEKAILLMTKTIARLLLKTSRRSDMVAYYGSGIFAMLLKHTDINSAKKASERLCDLVSSSNFFLGDYEVQLKISIGITDITENCSAQEIIVSSMDAMEKAYNDKEVDFAVALRKT
ncbi:GGDEF domain-containing protein [Sulfurimonas sp.]|uniref:GGDEF domain-containing protein n=1 Tax=Sulfurimonas sp. TaxID=2022749 RepID=UPI002601035E|nr:GGDEF domain-containing protein [Sulfurimonas sp.]MDD5157650.1 GGDEF domain-containing protein [Sulfurimonas sp.]